MNNKFNLDNGLSIYVVKDKNDPILTNKFYDSLHNEVFISKENNEVAGIINMNNPKQVEKNIERWLSTTSEYMFFLYEGNKIVGTTQAFVAPEFGENILSLGYIVSPSSQGKGLGTVMLKFVSEYLTKQDKVIILGFRDGNIASEKIAAKNNYSFLMRTNVMDAHRKNRPMTYFKYNGQPVLSESYNVIPKSKILTTKHWTEDKNKIISRVNPKMLSLEEYIYLVTSSNKPISLNETYFVFTSPHYGLKDKLKKLKLRRAQQFGLTDTASKKMFDPSVKGDILLNEFYNLVESNLDIIELNNDKTSMILGNSNGNIKVRLLDNMMLVEDYVIAEK